MTKQKNILIRDLTPVQVNQLEELKESTREKTASRAILRMLNDYKRDKENMTELREYMVKLREENRLMSETLENIRFQISCVPQK